ncbi:DUF2806 domain-containing protein [Chloroflexota bacterium]
MTDGFSLIKLDGELAKTATALINKISDAVGGLYKPYQIRRVAKAEADADLIKEQAHIEINDLQRRAFNRLVSEEAHKQNNIESITAKAIPQLTSSSNPDGMDNDWIMNFFDKCRVVSDDEMQLLWAKVLASEANSPGTYSKRLIISMGSLDKSEAQLFEKLCSFSILCDGMIQPYIVDLENSLYKHQEITFKALIHLDSIGLINFDALIGYKETELPQHIVIDNCGNSFRADFNKPENNEITIGVAVFTPIGAELSTVCSPKPIEGFLDYLKQNLVSQGLVIT